MENSQYGASEQLPNALPALILGILSIPLCGIGLVLGIIAINMANKDKKRYLEDMNKYSQASYQNLTAGRTCAIIGVVLSAVYIVFIVLYLLFIFLFVTKSLTHF